MTKADNPPWYEYVYDEYYDQIICPTYEAGVNFSQELQERLKEKLVREA